jgi:hypothetical protein
VSSAFHQDPEHGYPGVLAGYRPLALGKLALPALLNRIRGYRPSVETIEGLLGYDGVTASLIPQGGKWMGYYFNGVYANGSEVKALHPDAEHYVSITPTGANGAMVGDTEAGCMSVSQDPAFWHNSDHGTAADIGGVAVKPWIYCSAANLASVQQEMTNAGIPRSSYFLWSAHYTGVQHYCGPATCGYGLSLSDATQYATSADYDSDIAQPYVFEASPVVGTLPAPSGLSSTTTTAYVDLGWSAVAGAESYHWEVGTLLDATVFSESTPDQHVSLVSGLAAGTEYRWRVSAEHPAGNWSPWQTFVTPKTTYGPPVIAQIRPGHTDVYLAWSPPDSLNGVDASDYVIYIYEGTTCNTSTIVPSYPRAPISLEHAQPGGLAEHTEYTVHIVAGGRNMSGVAAGVYASATFTTGG